MATLSKKMLSYISKLYISDKTAYFQNMANDPVFLLAEYCVSGSLSERHEQAFDPERLQIAAQYYDAQGITGVIRCYFDDQIIDQAIDKELERKIVIMKTGLQALPSAKAIVLFKGFGANFTEQQVKQVYASYGLSNRQKKYCKHVDFFELNRRIEGLNQVINGDSDAHEDIHNLYTAIRNYTYENQSNKSRHIPFGMKKSLFLYYLKSVYQYGMLGLFCKHKSALRRSKINSCYESWMVINKIQHPEKTESDYLRYLKLNGVKAKRGSVNTVFRRWGVKDFQSAYRSNLERLQTPEALMPLT